jgi:targeting protein for Xklp2
MKSSTASNMKTTEELELEKMAQLQKELAKKRVMNLESFKMALAGRKPEPVHAVIPITKPAEFHFETDSRIKEHTEPMQKGSHEVDFVSLLRKNDPPLVSMSITLLQDNSVT